ncbi:hypothetical protein [Paenibacillus oceani]|uniref:Uncharacterized protein n=1 Tax=Paenibacillus oceani TaxID=2772510 RepID=A0A927GZP8_9BACL|nr:hypothetical protein [Paenibacillus oceani]MBD2863221.1 hypothetical protein [Paenibacillus oceani]
MEEQAKQNQEWRQTREQESKPAPPQAASGLSRRKLLAAMGMAGAGAAGLLYGVDRLPVTAKSKEVEECKTICVGSIAALLTLPEAKRNEAILYQITGYYAGSTVGGGLFHWDAVSTAADDGGTVFAVPGVLSGRFLRIHSGTLTLWDFGCVTAASFDNRERILAALYSNADTIIVPAGQFDSSPIQIGQAASGKRLAGVGFASCLSLIGHMTSSAGLLHFPRVGDPYGGAMTGAANFSIDRLRLRGDQATGTVSTTGLVIYTATHIEVGTLWSHGFYKSGMLIAGLPQHVRISTYYGYDNGNHPTSSTGGQGFAIVSDTNDYPAVHVEYAECWGNGLSNYGQGLDMVRGNATIGTLLAYDNGSSGMKIVNAQNLKIGTLIASRNNKHAGKTFGALYTNGDFGELSIGTFDVDQPAGSGLVIVNSGSVSIGSFRAKNCPSSAITCPLPAGKTATVLIGELEIDSISLTGLLLSAPSSTLHFSANKITMRNIGGAGIIANCHHFYAGEINAYQPQATPVLVTGSYGNFFVSSVTSLADTFIGTVVSISASVSRATILSIRKFGTHSSAIVDNGIDTYAPNNA